ncbi:MAG TPA: glutaredoxin [Candidatus Magasanikbacteria bacterium]|nr:glutaredoxin [Candidatus Magasanikbacteria bacterium]
MIELYQKEECPYCAKVRQFLSDHCIDWISRSCPKSCRVQREKLLELGGKEQVPFLVDPERNVSMYESDDIIAYLKEHYVK